MKIALSFHSTILFSVAFLAHGQGTILYDQQSSTNETAPLSGIGAIIQQNTPLGQSFTPTQSSVEFVRLKLSDDNPTNGLGATLYLILRTNSINGPVLGSTAFVSLTNGFAGVASFFFSNSVPLVPGTIYFLQVAFQSGDLWEADSGPYSYSGGVAFAQGVGYSGSDMWFREGIIVPEPSSALLVLIGGGLMACQHRNKRRSG